MKVARIAPLPKLCLDYNYITKNYDVVTVTSEGDVDEVIAEVVLEQDEKNARFRVSVELSEEYKETLLNKADASKIEVAIYKEVMDAIDLQDLSFRLYEAE